MRPSRLAKQASIPQEQVRAALTLLARANEITYGDWKRRARGKSGETFAYRVTVPDDYKPELREKPL